MARKRCSAWVALVTLSGTLAAMAWASDMGGNVDRSADLVARAESGDSWAQLNLGAAFDHGLAGFAPDPVRAMAWYRRAAAAGLAEAQFNLAHCLATGAGTARNDVEAFSWMLRAAEQGLPSAQFLAGVMLVEGIGIPPDPGRAQVWLQRAADLGNTDAATVLRRMRGLHAGD